MKGFTLIELILIIVVLGILAISTMPRFMNTRQDMRIVERNAVVSAVRSGVELYRANTIVNKKTTVSYPMELDDEGNGPCKRCFGEVLNIPLDNSYWKKVDKKIYKYDDGRKSKQYTYNMESGTFD